MNFYYATGAPIFEGPPTKHGSPSYGSTGHLENYLHKFQINVEHTTNSKNSAGIDLNLTAPDGKTLFVDWMKHEEMRAQVYKWAKQHGIRK